MNYNGHILKQDRIVKLIIEDYLEGKKLREHYAFIFSANYEWHDPWKLQSTGGETTTKSYFASYCQSIFGLSTKDVEKPQIIATSGTKSTEVKFDKQETPITVLLSMCININVNSLNINLIYRVIKTISDHLHKYALYNISTMRQGDLILDMATVDSYPCQGK